MREYKVEQPADRQTTKRDLADSGHRRRHSWSIFAIFTSIWTDRLWYRSFDYGAVFSKMLLTRVGLFVAFGLIMATCVVANAAIAFRMRPRLGRGVRAARSWSATATCSSRGSC